MAGRRNIKPKPVINYQLNNNIRVMNMIVIDSDGKQLGVKSKAEALKIAEAQDLDLYLVSAPNSSQAVAKILDYGKLKYDQAKKSKKLKQHQIVNKQIRLRAGIGDHDIAIKIKKARDFLIAKSRVKVSLRFRGREVTHAELGYQKLQQFLTAVEDIATTEQKIEKSGMFLNMFLIPISAKSKAKSKSQKGNNHAKDENKISANQKG